MIKNKKILVTGTTSGLGKAIVEYFSKENEIVSINRKDKVPELVLNSKNYNIDITNYENVKNLLMELQKNNTVPDYFILNAGINIYDNLDHFNLNNFKKCFDINFYGTMNFVGALEDLQIKNKTILFMSSTSNIIPNPAAFGYYSSKYLLFKSIEYLNKNKSNLYKAIILGPVETNISRNLEIPKGLSKLLLNFLNIRPELVVRPIEKFLLNKKSYLYFTFKAYIVYNIIYPILKIFPFLYKGPRKN